MRTKEIWTANCDEAINYPVERWNIKAELFFEEWCEFFGEDYENDRAQRREREIDKMVLAVIEKIYPMSWVDNFDYLEGLARLAQSGRIRRIKSGGWRIVKCA